MKKVYAKPTATFESFTLSANISAGCTKIPGVITNHSDMHSCGFTESGFPVFMFITTGTCDYTPSDEDVKDLCYDIPLSDNRIFGS